MNHFHAARTFTVRVASRYRRDDEDLKQAMVFAALCAVTNPRRRGGAEARRQVLTESENQKGLRVSASPRYVAALSKGITDARRD
jgi:hypothetical protein